MYRLSRLSLVLIMVAVFSGGVYCGILWSAKSPRLSADPLFTTNERGPALAVSATFTQHGIQPVQNDAPDTLPVAPSPSGSFSSTVIQRAASFSVAPPVPDNSSFSIRQFMSSLTTSPEPCPELSPELDLPNTYAAQVAQVTQPAPAEKMPFSPPSSFSLHKLGTEGNPTLLVIGGIHGNEPGGFSAAALLASHYTIHKGSVWIVPDLNFAAILRHVRGVHGDMNRKFGALDPKDPEYKTVTRIKSVLLDEQVALILNLHDGSGFYRPTWENSLRNPKHWGQSLIIDQATIDASRFGRLCEIACIVADDVNQTLLDPLHRYHIHNTRTTQRNSETAKEMANTLTYFAIRNGKAAFGVEASEELSLEHRTYYHLHVIESFMRQMGIEFERNFALTPREVRAALNSNVTLAAYSNRWMLQLDNVRPTISGFLPFKKGADPDIRASKPLLTIVPERGQPTWRVAYGNRTLTRVNPEFMEFDDSLSSVDMLLDGKPYRVSMGDMVTVRDSFLVKDMPGFRVTAIGALREATPSSQTHGQKKHQADLTIVHKDFMPRFSLDKNGTTYRVEVYKDNAFAGMVLVRFDKDNVFVNDAVPLTATAEPEKAFGF